MLNCDPKWMIQNKKKQYNRFSAFISEVILPYTTILGESFKRILEKHRKQTIFKPVIKSRTIQSSGKDIVPSRKCRGEVYEIPCEEREHKCIEETGIRLQEHHRDTLPENI